MWILLDIFTNPTLSLNILSPSLIPFSISFSLHYYSQKNITGGWPANAYEYIHLAGGITVESDYNYDSTEGETHDCKRSKAKPANFVVTVDNYYTILSEKDMVNYVLAKGRYIPLQLSFSPPPPPCFP